MNFRLARDQFVLLETAGNLWASRSKANDFFAVFFSSFELGVTTCTKKTLWLVRRETVSFVCLDLNEGLGETKLTVSFGASQ